MSGIVCKSCGSDQVAKLQWINMNDKETSHEYKGTQQYYCPACGSETEPIEFDCFLLAKIREIVNNDVDEIFNQVHELAQTKSGDITPDQQIQLLGINEQLVAIIFNQVKQNL